MTHRDGLPRFSVSAAKFDLINLPPHTSAQHTIWNILIGRWWKSDGLSHYPQAVGKRRFCFDRLPQRASRCPVLAEAVEEH